MEELNPKGVRPLVEKSFKKVVRKLRRAILRDEPGYYDMAENPGERFFARLYLNEIDRILQSQGSGPPSKVLDAGCQAGRLAVPLAQAGFQVTGVDTSDLALRRARRHAGEAGVTLELVRADLGAWLPRQPEGSFDVIVCTEVLYLRRNYRELLSGLIRVVRPGGLLFISHRPPAYYLAEALQKKDAQAVDLLLSAPEGELWGSYYNWQTEEELTALYAEHPVELLSIVPIGLLSWLAVKPDDFDDEGQRQLMEAELEVAAASRGMGRYLLVSGKKR